MKKVNYIFLIILLIGSVLRIYKIESFPPINADEAALAYNAYSFIKTGLDEHGNKPAINLQSFNDYKPALYSYLLTPIIYFFGMNNIALRSIGVLAAILSLVLFYLLVKKLFDKKTALIAMLFLSISPWHIHFSRGAWEVNLASFFILLGIVSFFYAKENIKFVYLSVLSFVLSMYTYHSARLISPLLVLGLIFFDYKNILNSSKKYIFPTFFGLLIIFPLVLSLFSTNNSSRALGVSIFADRGVIDRINEQRGVYQNLSGLAPKIFHNKVVNYSIYFFNNWLSHYHGEFLFLSGDEIQRNKVPETGQLYLFEIFTLIFGLYYFINKSNLKQKFVIWWLIFAPCAASLTFQSPHALRSQNMVFPLIIINAVGLNQILNKFKYNKFLVVLLSLVILWSFARYQLMYWIHMPKEYPFSSQYGLSELVDYLKTVDQSKKIYVTDRYDQPYILFLYYLNYSPFDFQKNHKLSGRDKYGFSTVKNFDRYTFEAIDYDYLRPNTENSIIVGTDKEIPPGANIVKKIYFPNGEIAFEVVEN